jgi:hypothetical protein
MAARRADAVAIMAEQSPEYRSASSDLLGLLVEAEQAGLPRDRAQRLRDRLERGPAILPSRMVELERSLRNWLFRKENVTGSRLSP